MDQHVWDHKVYLNPLVPKPNTLKETYTLSGASVAAYRTGLKMGSFRLDAGHSVFDSWKSLFISHGHVDHTFSLLSFLLVDHNGEARPIYVPEQAVIPLTEHVYGILKANYNSNTADIGKICKVQFIGVKPGQTLLHDDYEIKIFHMDHYIPTVGYGVSKKIKSINPVIGALLDKYPDSKASIMSYLKGRTDVLPTIEREDIALLNTMKEQGDKTHVFNTFPQFCFLTDTSIKGIIENLQEILQYPIIIVECTFYDTEDICQAHSKYHIHWDFLEPIMAETSLWILIHNSKKYPDKQAIMDILTKRHSASWVLPSNVLIW